MAKTPLDRVLEIVGGANAGVTERRTKVGEKCGISRQAVELWETDGIPPKHLFKLEQATGGKVTAREMSEWSRRLREKAAA